MDHVGDGTHHVHGVKHTQGLRGVGHTDGDLVTLPDTDGLQALGAGVDLLPHLGVGGGFAHELIGSVIGVLTYHLLDPAAHGQGGVVQGRGDLGVLGCQPRGLDLYRLTHR